MHICIVCLQVYYAILFNFIVYLLYDSFELQDICDMLDSVYYIYGMNYIYLKRNFNNYIIQSLIFNFNC